MELIEFKDDLKGDVRNIQNCPKCYSQRSLDAVFSKLCEKFIVVWTLQEPGYLMEPIGVKDGLRKGVRDVQDCQKGDSKKRWES